MLPKAFAHRAELLQPFLRVVAFPLEHDERACQLVGHFRASPFQFFLAATQFFEFPFLLLDLFLLPLELEQLLLRLLHLRIQMLRGERFFFAQFQHLLDRSNFFRHDNPVA